jgi:hypothetical protein
VGVLIGGLTICEIVISEKERKGLLGNHFFSTEMLSFLSLALEFWDLQSDDLIEFLNCACLLQPREGRRSFEHDPLQCHSVSSSLGILSAVKSL